MMVLIASHKLSFGDYSFDGLDWMTFAFADAMMIYKYRELMLSRSWRSTSIKLIFCAKILLEFFKYSSR
jgi:hypothetical protein